MPLSSRELLLALPRLRRYARLVVDDPVRADEIVATTLARARGATGAADRSQRVLLLNLLRSVHAETRGGNAASGAPLPVIISATPFDAEPDDDRTRYVLGELRRLPVEFREALVLVAVERMSYDEVALVLQLPVATVLSRLQEAREALRGTAIGQTFAHGGCG